MLAKEYLRVVNVRLFPSEERIDGQSNRDYPDQSYDSHSTFGNRPMVRQRRFNDCNVPHHMKSCFHDDRYYYQQVSRKTNGVKKCVERCNDLGEDHLGIETDVKAILLFLYFEADVTEPIIWRFSAFYFT